MIKVFIDTNILLDYYLNRDGADAAELLFRNAMTGKINLFASTLTFSKRSLNTDTDDTVISKDFFAYVYAHMYAKCFLKSSVLSVSSVSLYFCPRIVPLESALHHIFIGINDLL